MTHDTRIQGLQIFWRAPPHQGPFGARRGGKIFRNDRSLGDCHSKKKIKELYLPVTDGKNSLPGCDPHQQEGTIPRRDMGAAAPTYRLSETYPRKMTKSPKRGILSGNCLQKLFTYPYVNTFCYCECFPVLFFGHRFIKPGISCMDCIFCQIH